MESQKVLAGLKDHHEIVTFVVDFICIIENKLIFYFVSSQHYLLFI